MIRRSVFGIAGQGVKAHALQAISSALKVRQRTGFHRQRASFADGYLHDVPEETGTNWHRNWHLNHTSAWEVFSPHGMGPAPQRNATTPRAREGLAIFARRAIVRQRRSQTISRTAITVASAGRLAVRDT